MLCGELVQAVRIRILIPGATGLKKRGKFVRGAVGPFDLADSIFILPPPVIFGVVSVQNVFQEIGPVLSQPEILVLSPKLERLVHHVRHGSADLS